MWKKLAAAMVVTGTLSLGSVAVAAAAPTPAGAPTPAATGTARCADASRALARIQQVEGKIAARLAKLATSEQWAQSNHHPRMATRIERRIHRLEALQTRGEARSSRIKARCGGSTASSSSTTAAGQGATTLT